MALHSVDVDLDRFEHATVLAGLRLWQRNACRPDDLEYIACDGGDFTPLPSEQIDELIERINGVV
ncbi:hypothetical protein [Agrobacterium pusense]|uniref:Uncharacterized protein n=1 Tax=Agrobacterium pusense TaxID=648995 RepID=A0AA44EG04_9HYPH|nr:hypothetical protein [Agrobacterium pusense]MDH2091971.1 hypothetical protein [Agrobacterium pusense]NRF07732.1 hypothetical protein [Agrobacterium pusense]NRF18029.1 hypothetical protein [Agrobacterium pusense]